MDSLLAGLQETGFAQHLRYGRWTYAIVNALHIIGIAMLFGAALPLALRLVGVWKDVALGALARILVPIAASGTLIAMLAGGLLFSVQATEYADMPVFRIKMLFILVGLASALIAHLRYGRFLDRKPHAPPATHGIVSIVAWTSAIICGRLIAFMGS